MNLCLNYDDVEGWKVQKNLQTFNPLNLPKSNTKYSGIFQLYLNSKYQVSRGWMRYKIRESGVFDKG
jgi:hypothetical protein